MLLLLWLLFLLAVLLLLLWLCFLFAVVLLRSLHFLLVVLLLLWFAGDGGGVAFGLLCATMLVLSFLPAAQPLLLFVVVVLMLFLFVVALSL